MRYIVDTYLDKNKKLEILDVGSYDVNGSYKSLFQNPNWSYCGLDIVEGPNVDIVSKGLYDFGIDKQFDVVISGNCLEHVEAPWKWIQEVHKVVKKGGLVCIITPFSVPEHRYPIDCWRILPDGYRYLLEKESDFTILETRFNISKARYKFRNKKLTNRFAPKWLRKYYFKKVNIDDVFVVATKN
ncbi:MAG: methyltransferase domain-containing protein [Bacteroidales bacterium]|nr:methyltransferase domain-containing protein [Bacteroidales bacterium]